MLWSIQYNRRGTAEARHLHVTVSQALGGLTALVACMAPHTCIIRSSQSQTNSLSLCDLTNNRGVIQADIYQSKNVMYGETPTDQPCNHKNFGYIRIHLDECAFRRASNIPPHTYNSHPLLQPHMV
jgi:hypothetical protein